MRAHGVHARRRDLEGERENQADSLMSAEPGMGSIPTPGDHDGNQESDAPLPEPHRRPFALVIFKRLYDCDFERPGQTFCIFYLPKSLIPLSSHLHPWQRAYNISVR